MAVHDNPPPSYLPVRNIRNDGIYVLDERDIKSIWIIHFFKNGQISRFAEFVDIVILVDRILFTLSVVEGIKNPKTFANSVRRENESIVAEFITGEESNIITFKLKKDNMLQVVESYKNYNGKAVTTCNDYEFKQLDFLNLI